VAPWAAVFVLVAFSAEPFDFKWLRIIGVMSLRDWIAAFARLLFDSAIAECMRHRGASFLF